MTLNDLQRAAVALFAAREAGPEGSLDQMRAICHIIRNRVQAGWCEGYLDAVEMDYTVNADPQGMKGVLSLKDRNLAQLAKEIDEIFYGQDESETARICGRQDKERGPVLYWCFIDRPVTDWFKENIVRRPEEHRQRAQIGNMMYLYE